MTALSGCPFARCGRDLLTGARDLAWSRRISWEIDVSSHGSFNATAVTTFDAVAGHAATGGSMNGWIQRMVAASLLCGLTGVGSAQAEGGRIIFSGAVVVPTCSSQFEPSGGGAVSGKPRAFDCSASSRGVGRSNYRLAVTELDAAKVARNPLLQYFVGSSGTTRMAATRMLTRTYE